MRIENYIRIALCIFLLLFIFWFQRPLIRQQLIDLERQKKHYEDKKTRWRMDSIRRAQEIEMLDSALCRIKKIREEK